MSGALEGRLALVTGGGRGIGAAIARALAVEGAAVVVAARSAAEIDAVAAELRDAGAEARAVVCDVTDEAAVARMAEDVGPVDILINNAGAAASAPLVRTTLEEWERLHAVNATGPFLCMRAFAPGMIDRGWGRIVTIASVAGLHGARYIAAYSASKHAVLGLVRSAAAELGPKGVTVNAVCPAYVMTEMTRQTIANVMEKTGRTEVEAVAAILSGPQKRMIEPEEVAAAVVRLCVGDANAQEVVLAGTRERGDADPTAAGDTDAERPA